MYEPRCRCRNILTCLRNNSSRLASVGSLQFDAMSLTDKSLSCQMVRSVLVPATVRVAPTGLPTFPDDSPFVY